MSDETGNQNSSVNWGGLGKNLLAGAAIVAGAIIVFPVLAGALAAGIAGIGTAFGAASASVTASTAIATTAAATAAPAWAGGLMTNLIGIAIAAAGAAYLFRDKSSNNAPQSAETDEYTQRSFAAEQDIRKMQAIMLARMQANGYQPAYAMAQGR
jgi:uncharacterized membrane protein YccC